MFKNYMAIGFLCAHQAFAAFHENDEKKELPRFRIAKELNASASAQFSEDQLALILKKIIGHEHKHPSQIVIIDLREEAHFFANGLPFTITDIHEAPSDSFKSDKEKDLKPQLEAIPSIQIEPRVLDRDVREKYKKKLAKMNPAKKEASLKRNGHRLEEKKPLTLHNPIIRSEEELTALYGVQYKRIPLTDHFPPDREKLFELMSYIKSLPKDTWVHFHCRGGSGRATSIMAVMEMMTFKERDFYSILKNQHRIGGKNLAKAEHEPTRKKPNMDRLAVLKEIYDGLHS